MTLSKCCMTSEKSTFSANEKSMVAFAKYPFRSGYQIADAEIVSRGTGVHESCTMALNSEKANCLAVMAPLYSSVKVSRTNGLFEYITCTNAVSLSEKTLSIPVSYT